MPLMLDEHREYLADRARTALFRRAIKAVVRPGDVVLDLGSGTGLLGLLALKAGAARVYQVDESPMIEVARGVAAANGYGESTIAIHEYSSRARLPEKAGVVVADQLSHFGIGAGMPEIFNDARRRLLLPGARAIPRRLELFVAPVNFPEMARIASFWNKSYAGLKMTPINSIALNTVYPTRQSPRLKLGKPAQMFAFDLLELAPERFSANATDGGFSGRRDARAQRMVRGRAGAGRYHDQFAFQCGADSALYRVLSDRETAGAEQG